MKNRRLKQTALSIGIILSLALSSAAACACLHHQAKAETHIPSCHKISQNQQTAGTNKSGAFTQIGIACDCFIKTAAPFAVGKSEHFKTQKTQAITPVLPKTEFNPVFQIAPVKFDHTFHFYNSSYLGKLTKPRAPPIL